MLTGVFHQIHCWRNQSIEMKRTPSTDGISQKLFQTCHKVPEEKKRRKIMFKTSYVTEKASPHITLTCGGSSSTELELLIGMRRSRTAFQPCWWYDTTPLKLETVSGSIFSFPIEIQGHQSLCWSRGLKSFLSRTSPWNKWRSLI